MNDELRELLNQLHEALGKADALKDKIYKLIEDSTNTKRRNFFDYIEDEYTYVYDIYDEALEEYLNEHKGE